MRIPLWSGAYSARSVIANAQRCVNLFPEANPEETSPPTPVTHYPTPGLRLLKTPPAMGAGRGIYRSTRGDGFCVIGTTVYYIDTAWNLNEIGNIAPASTPVSFSDNGLDYVVLVDGTNQGYKITIEAPFTMAPINDPAFYGAVRTDFLDTFMVFPRPDSNQWYCSLSNQIEFDGLDIAAKSGGADYISTLIVKHREAWILGLFTSEVWGNVGGQDFPFAPLPGAFIDHGCIAPYSVAKYDVSVFWLSQDSQGKAIVMKSQGYQAKRISNHAIEFEFQNYKKISDAIGFTFQQIGHTFYVLTFPAADKTWVYDDATQQWFEWNWVDNNGKLHRHRANGYAFLYGENAVIDFQNGNIYALDPNVYTDNGQPIVRIRSFPHLVNDGKRISYQSFIADIQSGTLPGYATDDASNSDFNWDFNSDFGGSPNMLKAPLITLRYSDDRGQHYSGSIQQLLGSTGQYAESPKWAPLGMARDRVFELSWSIPAAIALNGGWIEAVKSAS
jgi:hypothetical protein